MDNRTGNEIIDGAVEVIKTEVIDLMYLIIIKNFTCFLDILIAGMLTL